jgi:hypothetical protein
VPLEGSAYLVRNRAVKCYAVEAAISRRGRAFLGVATARARSGRRGQADVTAVTVPAILRRDDSLFAVAWPLRSWWGPPVSEKGDSLQLMRAGRPPRRARPRLINLRGGKNGGFYLSISPFSPLVLSPPVCSCHRAPSPLELLFVPLFSALAFLVLSDGAASGGARSTGGASSWGSPRRRPRSTRPLRRTRRKKLGAGPL